MKSFTIFLAILLPVALASYTEIKDEDIPEDMIIDEINMVQALMAEKAQSGQEMCIGGDSCCTADNLCGVGEGDCDGAGGKQCLGYPSLVCGSNNCKDVMGDGSGWSLSDQFDGSDDCCAPRPFLIKYMKEKGTLPPNPMEAKRKN